MQPKQINGYSFDKYPISEDENTPFATLRNGSITPYHFSLEKVNGHWRISHSSTIPAFIVETEHKIVKGL